MTHTSDEALHMATMKAMEAYFRLYADNDVDDQPDMSEPESNYVSFQSILIEAMKAYNQVEVDALNKFEEDNGL